MKRIGILTNLKKDPELVVTQAVKAALLSNGIEPLLTQEAAAKLGSVGYEAAAMAQNSDAIIVLGGDGTVLHIVSHAMQAGVPMLAVNMGHMGFLTEIEQGCIKETIALLVSGDYHIEERMMLSVNHSNQISYALNELAVIRARSQNTIRLRVSVNGYIMNEFAGDGVLVASPTGSTAYSLSAGGPILTPCMNAIIITPVCAHSLLTRPVVLEGNDEVAIEIVDGLVHISIDGKDLPWAKDKIIVTKAIKTAKFIRLKERNFYEVLRDRFSDWARLPNSNKD